MKGRHCFILLKTNENFKGTVLTHNVYTILVHDLKDQDPTKLRRGDSF